MYLYSFPAKKQYNNANIAPIVFADKYPTNPHLKTVKKITLAISVIKEFSMLLTTITLTLLTALQNKETVLFSALVKYIMKKNIKKVLFN